MLQHPKYAGAALYNIITATRGCDVSATAVLRTAVSTVKEHITGRLRAIACGTGRPSLALSPIWTTSCLQETEMQTLAISLRQISSNRAYDHWLQHLHDAVMACQDEPIWGGQGKALIELLRRV